MPVPKHDQILKTLKRGRGISTDVDFDVDIGSTNRKSSTGIPSHSNILKTIRSNPEKFKSRETILPPPSTEEDEQKPQERGLFRNILGDIGTGLKKFVPRVGVEAANLFSSTADAAADILARKIEKDLSGESPFARSLDSSLREGASDVEIANIDARTKKGKEMAEKWRNFYDNQIGNKTEQTKQFTQSLRESEIIKPTEEWQNTDFKEKFKPEHVAETIFYVGPGALASLGIFALSVPVGFAVSAGSVADDVRTSAVEAGVDPDTADRLGLGTGLLVGAIDKVVPDELFSPREKGVFMTHLAKRLLKTAGKEAGTEIVQEDLQIAVESTFRDDLSKDEVFTRNAMAGLGGFIGGAAGQTAVSFMNQVREGNIGAPSESDMENLSRIGETLETGTEPVTLFRGVNPDRPRSQVGFEEGVTFYTTDREVAADYALAQTDDRIKSLNQEKDRLSASITNETSADERQNIQDNILQINEQIREIQQQINDDPDSIQIEEQLGEVQTTKNPLKNPLVIDAEGQTFDQVTESAITQAREAGNDGVVIKNVIDPIGVASNKPTTVVAAFNQISTQTPPPAPASADPIARREQDLRDAYSQKADEAEESLGRIWMDLGLAEPGQRVQRPDGTFTGFSSTFPEWIPEGMRSRRLIDKLLDNLTLDNLTYPTGNRTAQRALYDEILSMVDQETGIDTREIRNDILNLYESPDETTETVSRSTQRSGEGTSPQEDRVIEQTPSESQQRVPTESRAQLERSSAEIQERTVGVAEKKAVNFDPSSESVPDIASAINETTKDMDEPPTARNTKTVRDDWSGKFALPEGLSLTNRIRRKFEDMNIALKGLNGAIEETSGDTMDETLDLWAQKDMLPRKQSDELRRIRDRKRDFVERVIAAGVTIEQVDEYRRALHAKERNAAMNKLRVEQGKEPQDGLSGMTNAEAEEILARDNSELEPFASELSRYDTENLDYMVENDLVATEDAKAWRNKYDNYAPLFRDMGEDFTGIGVGRGITTPKDIVKRAKGSKRRVLSTAANTFHRMERLRAVKLKNDIGETIVDLVNKYPFLEGTFVVQKEPVRVIAKREVTAEVDQKFTDDLVAFAQDLGLEVVERKGQANRRLGYYSPSEKKILTKFATSRETLAHEVGHFLDDVTNLSDRVVVNEQIRDEIYKHSEEEAGESATRLAKPEERFANAFSWWLTHRDLATDTMPAFNEEITRVVTEDPKLKPLLDIKPSAAQNIESITENVWGRYFKVGDDVILTRIKGEEYFITVKDPDLARSLKNLNLVKMPEFTRTARNMLAIWSSFKTRWRPEFALSNFQRDLGEAMVNLNVEQSELADKGKGLKRSVAKGLIPAQKSIWAYLRGNSTDEQVDKFFALGGDTGHFWLEPVQEAEQSLLSIQKEIQNVGVEKFKNPVRKAARVIDDVQTMVELGVRFSAYKELTARGLSEERAVQAAADLTINFSRQGELSPALKAAYGFIGPAIQGTSKVIRTTTSKTGRKRVLQSITAITLLGFLTRIMSKLIDEEGDEQISEWTKNHKLAFSIGNGREVSLWNMPYGYTTFYSLGSQIAEVTWGSKDIDEAFTGVLDTAANSFSPFGTRMNDLIPTLAQPIYDINQNVGWYDGRIHPEQIFTKTPKPNNESYFENTSEVSKFITSMLNNLTGGSEGKSGLVDIHPDDLEYLYDQWLGGPFEFVTSSLEAAGHAAKGEFDPNRTPFVRYIYRNGTPQQWSYGVIYDTLEMAYKTDLSETEKDRFYRAVDTGLEEGIFDDGRAERYIRDFVRAIYKIEGSVTDKENIEKLRKATDQDKKRLFNTYEPATANKLKVLTK